MQLLMVGQTPNGWQLLMVAAPNGRAAPNGSS